MSTRANIKIEAEGEKIHLDRSHDGFPEKVLPDIKEVVDLCNDRWPGPGITQFVSAFLGLHFNRDKRIQIYEPCIGYCRAGDESYCYEVKWNPNKREWEVRILET